MFESSAMLFLYTETPLHAGTGRGLGVVDLPIQRERTTGYPIVQASGLKGCLRSVTRGADGLSDAQHAAIFGPETSSASDHAGALSVGDARTLLFPIRSLAGVFAWVTSVEALARFQRDAARAGLAGLPDLPPAAPDPDAAWVNGEALVAGGQVVLEEFSFDPRSEQAAVVRGWGEWLAANALSEAGEYAYWRRVLPDKLCVLPEDAFRDFLQYGTEIQTHVRLISETKTVAPGALWTVESLPADALLYAPLLAARSRAEGVFLSGEDALLHLNLATPARTQLGGHETTGQGMVNLRMTGGPV